MRTHTTTTSERSAGPREWRLLVGGAAALVIGFILFSVLRDPGRKTERPGPFAIECTSPKGSVTRFTEFRARGAKPPGGWFRFELFDATAPASASPVLVADQRLETVFVPKPDELRALPEHVRWRISAVGADGIVLDTKECEARRAP